jgi:hypothetical protein
LNNKGAVMTDAKKKISSIGTIRTFLREGT